MYGFLLKAMDSKHTFPTPMAQCKSQHVQELKVIRRGLLLGRFLGLKFKLFVKVAHMVLFSFFNNSKPWNQWRDFIVPRTKTIEWNGLYFSLAG